MDFRISRHFSSPRHPDRYFRGAGISRRTADRHPKVLDECRGDNALIEKAITNLLAAITCPISRFYGQVTGFVSNGQLPRVYPV